MLGYAHYRGSHRWIRISQSNVEYFLGSLVDEKK